MSYNSSRLKFRSSDQTSEFDPLTAQLEFEIEDVYKEKDSREDEKYCFDAGKQ